MNDFYTYAYLREDKTPYYIGKGKGDRACIKHWRSKSRGGYFTPPEKNRILILKNNLTEEEAFKHEIYMIAVFGRKDLGTGILRNLTDGGEGTSGRVVSEETKKKQSGKMKGRILLGEHKRIVSEANKRRKGEIKSEEIRRKMSEANKGEKNSFYGKTHTEETRRKLSELHKGKTVSEQTRKKLGIVSKGRKWWNDGCGNSKFVVECPGNGWKPGRTGAQILSEQTKKKRSKAMKGRKWWNDGCGNRKFVVEYPGNGWKPGMK
jgi:hypothetical protein